MLKSTFDKNMKNLSKTHENKPNYAAYNKAVDISELTKDSVTVLNSNRNKLADKNSEIAQSYLKDSLIEEYKKFKIAIRGLLAPKTNVVQNVLVNNASVPDESIFDDLTKMLSEIDGFVGRVMQNPTDVFQNDLYYIQQKVKPMIGKLVVVAELDSKYLDEVKKTEIALTAILTHQLNDSLLSEFSENTLLSSENSVIGTINKLSDLDDPVFYQSILANLKTELIEFFEKDTASKGLKVMLSLLSNIDLNTLTNVANKTLEIDVEEIIIWMYDTFIDKVVDGGGRISPYFTIGLNYSNLKPIDLDESDKINQFSYASEKIGFAWKIIDVKHKRATKDFRKFTYTDFCTGKKKTKTKVLSPEPIISNIHLLSYASGLLYTLVDATTEEEFDSPLAAVGVGLTFFNSLELNFSHVWPLDSDRSPTYPRFFQVSFDVKIVDYLSAARKKRLNLKGK